MRHFNHRVAVGAALLLVTLGPVTPALGQMTDSTAAAGTASVVDTVPRLIKFSGVAADMSGKPLSGTVGVTFLLYREEQGGSPLWLETQNVQADGKGHYSVQLGATKPQGLPVDVFASGEARWLGVQIGNQPEQPRALLLSVPYALKAADAETIGGLPPSAFVLAAPPNAAGAASIQGTGSTQLAAGTNTVTTAGGSVNQLAKFDASADVANSIITDTGTRVGINTTTPGATLDVNGASTIRGTFNLTSAGTASSTGGKNSQALDQIASSFNSSTGKAASQEFRWLAEPAGNNTASPSGTLNLLFGSNGAAPAETGLKIGSNGQITFATGQTFPVLQSLDVSGLIQGQFGNFTGSNSGDIFVVQNQNTSGGIGLVSNALGSNGIGMEGNSLSAGGTGVQGSSSGANGVGIKGTGATGVTGIGAFPSSIGVSGVGGSASTSFGVIGTSGGVGVSGTGNLTPGSGGIGVTGTGASTGVSGSGGIGVSGTGTGVGVFAKATGSEGFGVSATGAFAGIVASSTQTTGFSNAVFGATASTKGMGGLFEALGTSKTGSSLEGCCPVGVWGDTASNLGGAAGLAGTADDAQALFLQNNSTTHLTANINNVESTTHNVEIVNIKGAFGSCNVDTDGNLNCTGAVNSHVVLAQKRSVALYAMESPQNWFEDFGSGQLDNGLAKIILDPTFAEAVNTDIAYHVFLTPRAECGGLYVSKATAGGFEVHELHHGRSNVAFDYRIVAVRRGFESLRMEDVTERDKKINVAMPTGVPGKITLPGPPVHNGTAKLYSAVPASLSANR